MAKVKKIAEAAPVEESKNIKKGVGEALKKKKSWF